MTLHLDLEDYTQRTIFYDAFEVEELNFLCRTLSSGDVLLDVGLGALGRLRSWRYAGEPTIPPRRTGPTGLVRNVYMGLQDLRRKFNLIALRRRPGL